MSVGPSRASWDAETVKLAALARLPEILTLWGVRTTGRASESGFLECHAATREDANPSAGVSINTGVYRDFGGAGETLSLFDLSVAVGAYPDFPSAVDGLGEWLGVLPASGTTPTVRRSTGTRPLPPVDVPPPPARAVVRRGYVTYAAAVEAAMRSRKLDGHEVVAEYRYDPEIVIVRFEKYAEGERVGKSFRPFYRGSDRLWRAGKPPGDRPYPLFGLPDLRADGVVVFVEGEKCQEIAASIGLVAVACAHGAQSPALTDHSPLAGRRVAIIPDAGEAGEAFAVKLAAELARLDPPAIVRTVRLPGLGDGEDIEQFIDRHPSDALDLIDHLISGAFRVADGEGIGRPSIEISTDRHRVVQEALEALAADPGLFRRGDSLVTVVREDASLVRLTTRTAMAGVAGSAKIVELAEPVIGERLTRFADFFAWRKDRRGEAARIEVHPPTWLLQIIAARKDWPGIRPLVAVAECPFPRPDGTIVEEAGYDAATATLYAPTIAFPPIPRLPSRSDAMDCWGRIGQFIRHFPFATEDDRVVYLAGALNVLARHGVVGPMPGIAVCGNKPGTGKGLLVDGMVIPGTGRLAPVSKYPHDPAEAGKVKTAIVRSGKTVVSFDNLAEGSRYGGEDIDSLITSRVTDDRILGSSDNTGDLVVRLCCFINGNNIEPAKDAWRRWLVINLVTDLEHPERRDDIRGEDGEREAEFPALILEHRAEIVRDLLTILRAHAIAGWPGGNWSPAGSFGEWDRVVRGAVWFATGRDCLVTQGRAAEESTDHRDKIALLEGLRELPGGKIGGRGVTASEAVALVEDNLDEFHTLRAALLQRGSKGRLADSRTLGNILRGLVKTPMGGLRLLKHPILKHQAVAWIVEGESGGTGESVSADPL